MNRTLTSLGVLILIVAAAATIRLVHLDNRPMHTDEAVHGAKFGPLLEKGIYEYDPHEFHGPTLNYLTIPVVRMGGGNTIAQTTEVQLRIVPAICGILLIAGLWIIRDAIGLGAMLCAAALCAASPAMIFYSRYYIQEMLLICFTFFAIAAFWRSAQKGTVAKFVWLAIAGFSIGLMHATKETCIIALFAMFAGGIYVAVLSLIAGNGWTRQKMISLSITGGVVLVAAALVSVTLFSSLFTHPAGISDSITSIAGYVTRSGGEGSAGNHSYPWYNYLRIVCWWQDGEGPVWTEMLVVILAVVGLIAGLIGKGCGKASIPFVRFLGVYTIVMTVGYSYLSYKTPWCLLGFFHGMLLLAGIGAAVLWRAARPAPIKALVAVMLLVAGGHLAWQGWRGSFPQCADPDNPYVYAHTTHDVPKLANLIREIALEHPDQKAMCIQIVGPEYAHWPLPWYLRDFTKIDWYGNAQPDPLIVVRPEDDIFQTLLNLPRAYTHVKPENKDPKTDRKWWELRPNIWLEMRVEPDLFKKYKASHPNQTE